MNKRKQNTNNKLEKKLDVLEADTNRRGETFRPTKNTPKYYWSSPYGI